IGAAVASFLFGLIGVGFGGWIGYLVAGVLGACILIGLVRAIRN
ncbi:MAG: GlsB/YeaQ/YmgE family stress response membrane protein, partial [Starkeya sp.]|nr:GlsB/YeaQ/YmgE family stress response membrane protein [Starkeya sp.]